MPLWKTHIPAISVCKPQLFTWPPPLLSTQLQPRGHHPLLLVHPAPHRPQLPFKQHFCPSSPATCLSHRAPETPLYERDSCLRPRPPRGTPSPAASATMVPGSCPGAPEPRASPAALARAGVQLRELRCRWRGARRFVSLWLQKESEGETLNGVAGLWPGFPGTLTQRAGRARAPAGCRPPSWPPWEFIKGGCTVVPVPASPDPASPLTVYSFCLVSVSSRYALAVKPGP